MSTKARIYVSDVVAAVTKLDTVNALTLSDCEIVDETGEIFSFTDEQLKDWRYIGLSNKDFVAGRVFETIEQPKEE